MAAPPSLTTDPVAGQRLGSYVQERVLVDRAPIQWVLAHEADNPTRRVVIRKRRETTHDRGAQAQFLARARAASKLELPGLVPVREARLEGTVAYAAMDCLEGATLEGLLRTWSTAKAPLPTGLVIGIVVEILETLDAVHRSAPVQGMPFVHGAVEPRRIRLLRSGEVKLGGLARETDDAGVGFYPSPEQLRRDPLEPKSDVFSVGLILYELLGGSRPFPGLSGGELRAALLYQTIPSVRDRQPNLRPALDTVVQAAIARDRQTRIVQAGELARRLTALDNPMPAAARAEWLGTVWREVVQNSVAVSDPASEAPATPGKHSQEQVVAAAAGAGRTMGIVLGVLAVLAGAVVGGALWLSRVTPAPERQDLTGGMQPIPGVERVDPSSGPGAGGGTALATDGGAGAAPVASTSSPPGNPQTPPSKPLHPSGPSGSLTLVTSPPVDVFLKGRSLGKTPLFQVSLPTGTQQLRFRFADGREQRYPVTVRQGKVTQLRLDLQGP